MDNHNGCLMEANEARPLREEPAAKRPWVAPAMHAYGPLVRLTAKAAQPGDVASNAS